MSTYSFLDKLLHRVALKKHFARFSFDLEKSLYLNQEFSTDNKHVFVTGLARAGTTALTIALEKQPLYHSLTYRNMPFLLMPNLKRKIYNNKDQTVSEVERSHGDGIKISVDSPEMLEEFFWRILSDQSYIKQDKLVIQDVSEEMADNYKAYVNLILISNKRKSNIRYLSKNNNQILRWKNIEKIFPQALFLIIFRDPVQHAISLIKQHERQSGNQQRDVFTLEYMNWLGHHEFGLGHKPFYLGDDELFEKIKTYPRNDINYWLLNWLQYYQYALTNYPRNSLFISHEMYCHDPKKVFSFLKRLNVEFSDIPDKHKIVLNQISGIDSNILEQCNNVYSKLYELSGSE